MPTPSPSRSTAVPPQSLSCSRCRYPLDGLLTTSICPECAYPISASLAAAQLRAPAPPLTPATRILRTAYTASFMVLLLAPFVLPSMAQAFGLPHFRIGYSHFGLPYFICGVATATAGVVLAMRLPHRKHRQAIALASSAVFLMCWCMIGLGST